MLRINNKTQKQILREKLEKDITVFLEKGGEIKKPIIFDSNRQIASVQNRRDITSNVKKLLINKIKENKLH